MFVFFAANINYYKANFLSKFFTLSSPVRKTLSPKPLGPTPTLFKSPIRTKGTGADTKIL